MAGGLYQTNNSNAYYDLNKTGGSSTGSYWWWTMSPSWWNGAWTHVFIMGGSTNPGSLSVPYINDTGVIRPVISVKSTVTVTGGNGTGDNPYTIKNS